MEFYLRMENKSQNVLLKQKFKHKNEVPRKMHFVKKRKQNCMIYDGQEIEEEETDVTCYVIVARNRQCGKCTSYKMLSFLHTT